MSGISEIIKQSLDRIENVLKDKPEYFRGFVNFMNDSSVQTKYNYLNHVCAFMNFTNKEPKELVFDDFNNYMMKISYKEDGSQMTSSYRINIYSSLKKFNEYLCSSGRLDRTTQFYMRDIKRPKPKESQETVLKRENGFLTEKEINKYLEEVEWAEYIQGENNPWVVRDKAIIYTLLTTGIRNTALRMIDLDDIDMDNQILTVTDKGEKVRQYEMSDKLVCALNHWIKLRNSEVMIGNDDKKCKALFVSCRRQRINIGTLKHLVKKYAVDINNKNITPHKLRATYGTQLYNKTGDIYFVQQCMGHSNPKTTELYVREKKQNTKRASDIMNKML